MQLSKKQNEYIVNATHRWNIKSGAVRSGKSYVDTAFVVPFRIRERTGKPGLNVILGVSKESIERNVLQPMREIYTEKLIGQINNRNMAHICGEEVYCLGAEKVSQVAKIQGASIKYCYGDEVAKWNKEVFQMLKSRLDKPYSCFDGSCNPEHPTHWLKEFLDNDELDIYLQRYTIFDNPFLPVEFVEQLCKEYEGTIYYDRLIFGLWKRAEGAIYKRFADNPERWYLCTHCSLSIRSDCMNVSYEYYKDSFGGSLIQESRWNSLEIKMSARLNRYTFDRMTEGAWSAKAKTALCEMCDCAYKYDQRDGKTSENNDGYSVSYDTGKSLDSMLYEIAEVYLVNTGLMSWVVDDDDDQCDDYNL